MATQYAAITPKLADFIAEQHVFFVATAARDGRVNVSPKGLESLAVLDPNRVLWLNLTGSGNETAAHLLDSPRMTLMFCAMAGKPLILRLYGTARMVQPVDDDWADLATHFPPLPGARQIFDVSVDLVQTSCGFGVPLFTFDRQRDLLPTWARTKGTGGLAAYQQAKNAVSIDGFPTGLPS